MIDWWSDQVTLKLKYERSGFWEKGMQGGGTVGAKTLRWGWSVWLEWSDPGEAVKE